MSDARRSSMEIEREVERTRSEVDETVYELKDRFSPESAAEYAMNYLRGPGGERLLGAARDNPLAVVMALAGIGWLLYTANRPEPTRGSALGRRGSAQADPERLRRRGPPYPGMMGDGTEEQNLNQPGDTSARISREEVEVAFGRDQGSLDTSR